MYIQIEISLITMITIQTAMMTISAIHIAVNLHQIAHINIYQSTLTT